MCVHSSRNIFSTTVSRVRLVSGVRHSMLNGGRFAAEAFLHLSHLSDSLRCFSLHVSPGLTFNCSLSTHV